MLVLPGSDRLPLSCAAHPVVAETRGGDLVGDQHVKGCLNVIHPVAGKPTGVTRWMDSMPRATRVHGEYSRPTTHEATEQVCRSAMLIMCCGHPTRGLQDRDGVPTAAKHSDS